MATENFKRRGKKSNTCFLLPLKREIQMSDTCSLFPLFGDPWPSCLLSSQQRMHRYLKPDSRARPELARTCCLVTHSCLFETPWTVVHQTPLSMEFPKQEYWSGLPCLSPEDISYPGVKPASPALAGRVFTHQPPGKPSLEHGWFTILCQFLQCSNMNPLYILIHPAFWIFFPFRPPQSTKQGSQNYFIEIQMEVFIRAAKQQPQKR